MGHRTGSPKIPFLLADTPTLTVFCSDAPQGSNATSRREGIVC